MRKAAKLRNWTTYEVRYLTENAGRIPKRDICKHLKRSSKAVECKAARLRREGSVLCLRCFKSSLETCPSCGRLSSHLGREGFCEPCRRTKQLQEIQGRIAHLLSQLPAQERSVYETTEAELASRNDPMPTAPSTAGLDVYHASKLLEQHERAMESWATRNLQRQIKAAQKRKERIEKKVKSMRVCI